MYGKFGEVDDTDAEGRLVLAGECHFNCVLSGTLKLAHVLHYASTELKSHTVIGVATLTGCVALLNPLILGLCAGQWILHWVRYTRMPSVTMAADNRNIVKQMVDLRYPFEPT